mgnify:FL=1
MGLSKVCYLDYVFFECTSPVLYDCSRDQCIGAEFTCQSFTKRGFDVSLMLPFAFAFESFDLDTVTPAMKSYCHSLDDRMHFVYKSKVMPRDKQLPDDLSNENSSLVLKRSMSTSMDAVIDLPVRFTVQVSNAYTFGVAIQMICDGIFRRIMHTVLMSTDAGYSVM